MDNLMRYSASIFATFLCLAALFLLDVFPIWWVFIIIIFILFVFLFFLHKIARKNCEGRNTELILLFFTALSFICLLSIVERNAIKLLLMALNGLFVFFLLVREPEHQASLPSLQKPIRRIMMMALVFDVFCLLSFIFALNIFFSEAMPFFVLSIIGGLIIAFVSHLIWRIYFGISDKRVILWLIVISFAMFEVILVLHFLTVGFFILGALAAWIWYVSQLLVRFYLSPQGIIWPKQKLFLIINIFLCLVALLFFVKWV